METPLSWEQQEVFRLLKSQPGTMYQESDETGRHIFRDWMRGLLDVSEVTVTFVKADGTLRDMRCTLDRDKIRPSHHVQPSRPKNCQWMVYGKMAFCVKTKKSQTRRIAHPKSV
jgi:hypothetical protein